MRMSDLAVIAGFMFLAAMAYGADEPPAPRERRLVLGRSSVIDLERDIIRVAVGDPASMSVVVVNPREVLCYPKKTGRTNLILWFSEKESTEWLVVIEHDLKLLREHLKALDPSITVETADDGHVVLTGTVPTYNVMRAAVDVAARFLEDKRVEVSGGVIIEAEKKPPPDAKPGTPPEAPKEQLPDLVEKGKFSNSIKIRNLLLVKELPESMQDRIQELVRPYSGDIRVRLLGAQSFVMEGTISDAASYFQLLALLDSLLGGDGKQLNDLNLGGNGVVKPVVRLGNGKLLSMLRIVNVPPTLEKRLEEAARLFGSGITIRRVQKTASKPKSVVPTAAVSESNTQQSAGNVQNKVTTEFKDGEQTLLQPASTFDDVGDAFVVEGMVPSQSAYTRMLTLLDKMLGGSGENFEVIADDSGGLANGRNQNQNNNQSGNQSSTGSGSVINGSSGTSGSLTSNNLVFNNLNRNIGRALITRTENGRLISFVRVSCLPQVLVAVRIIEFDRSKLKNSGINLRVALANFKPGVPFVPQAGIDPAFPPSPGIATTTPPNIQDVTNVLNGLTSNNLTIVGSHAALDAAISILETDTLARTLSEPNLMALSGETATFLVGTRVSFADIVVTTATANQTVTQSNTRDETFGIKLSIRPIVAEDNSITLDIVPEISTLTSLTASTRTSDSKGLQTSVRLQNGEGLVLGGLISTNKQQTTNKTPVLGDIPGVGALFRKTTKSVDQTELVFVLIPKIVEARPESTFATEPPGKKFKIRGGQIINPQVVPPRVPASEYQNAGEIVPLETQERNSK